MQRFISTTVLFILFSIVSLVAQTKEKQLFKFNTVKNDTLFLSDLNSRMELVTADKSLEVVSFDLVCYVYENTYKYTMNGSRLAESIVTAIKNIKPKPRKIVVENIVAYTESDGKEKPYKGFTLYVK